MSNNKHTALAIGFVAAGLAIASTPSFAQTTYEEPTASDAPATSSARYEPDAANARYDTARVVKVDAIVSHGAKPTTRETCWQEPVTVESHPTYTYYRDDDSHSGPTSVTVASGDTRTTTTVRERCKTETNWQSTDRVLGYDVTYRYGGRTYQTHMDHDPGDQLRVRVNYDPAVTPDD